jgi:hypothetical protein
MKSSGTLPSIVAVGAWVYQTSVAQQASQFIGLNDGTTTNRSMLGSDITGAGGKGSAVQSNATPTNSQALTDTAGTANTWVLYVGAFLTYPNNQIVWMAGAHKGTKGAIVNPAGLSTLQLGGRGTQTEAHAFALTRAPTDLEVAALGLGLVNPRALGLSNYYYVSTTGATETDRVGTLDLTNTGTTAGSVGDPQIATWFTGTAISNQSWTQGAAITAIDLTTKFDNGVVATAPWTGTLKQLGAAGTATAASGSAVSASTQLTTTTPLTAGQWVKVGSNALTPVLYASGNTALLQTALTWADGVTVTPYPVQAVTAITSNGVTVSANSLTGTPGAGAVGTFNNCLIQAANNSSGAVAYSNLFNVAVASSGAAPSFTSGPTLTSANTDGYTYGATSNQTGTWHLGVYLKGSSVPSAANLKGGAGTGFVAHFSVAVTSATPASLSATALTFPFHDVHQLVTSGAGDSTIVSNLAVFKAPPAGKQHVTAALISISAITKANPVALTTSSPHGRSEGDWVEVFGAGGMTELNGAWAPCHVVDSTHLTIPGINSTAYTTYTSGGNVTWGRSSFSGSSTAIVSGDVMVADITDGQGIAVTFTAEGVAIFATNSVARQNFTKDVYSVSLGNFIGSAADYENDAPPIPPGQTGLLPSVFFPLGQQSSSSIVSFFQDPQSDDLTSGITALTALPSGRTLVSGAITGIASVTGVITPVTFQAQNASSEISTAVINVIDGGISVPNGLGKAQEDAQALAEGIYLTTQVGSQDDSNPAGPAAAGVVIAQSPAAGQVVLPGTLVVFTISTGNAPPVIPVDPPVTVVKSPTIQYEESAITVNNYRNDEAFGQVVMGPSDPPGQVYRVCRISAAARVIELEVAHDANPSNSLYAIGVRLPNNGGVVVAGSDSLFVSNLSLDTARLNWVDVYSPVIIGGSRTLANYGKRVWELLGLSADPSPATKDNYYDVVLVAIQPGTVGGTINIRLSGRLITSLRVP